MLQLDHPQQQSQASEDQGNKPSSSAFRANSMVVGDPSRDLLIDNRGSSVWSVLPSDAAVPSALVGSSKVLGTESAQSMGPLTASAAVQQTSALSAMQDAAAAYDSSRMISGYYNHPYASAAASATNYGVAPNYYQSLRNAGFGYFSPAAPSSYASYPASGFDYTYPNCYGTAAAGRNAYYGATGAALGSYFPTPTTYPNSLPDSKSSSSQISPLGQSLRCSEAKKAGGKSVKKKKSSNGTATPEECYKRVFIWDLEDICVFSNMMLDASKKDPALSEAVKRIVGQIISEVFHIESGEISECEQVNIEDANVDETMQEIGGFGAPSGGDPGCTPPQTMRSGVDWLRKVATRYQQVKEAYNQYRTGNADLGDRCGFGAERAQALKLLEFAFTGWSERFRNCLQLIADSSANTAQYANVVISNEGLITSFAKLMATDLAATVDVDNVYSTVKMTKDAVIERIRTKFGKNCTFMVVSMRPDTQSLVKSKFPNSLWRILQREDLEALYRALTDYLLG